MVREHFLLEEPTPLPSDFRVGLDRGRFQSMSSAEALFVLAECSLPDELKPAGFPSLKSSSTVMCALAESSGWGGGAAHDSASPFGSWLCSHLHSWMFLQTRSSLNREMGFSWRPQLSKSCSWRPQEQQGQAGLGFGWKLLQPMAGVGAGRPWKSFPAHPSVILCPPGTASSGTPTRAGQD